MSEGKPQQERRITRQMEDLPLATDETAASETTARPRDPKPRRRGAARQPNNQPREEEKA